MADNKNGADAPAGGSGAPDPASAPNPTTGQTADAEANVPPMTINAHYLKDLSFENPKAPHSLMQMTSPPDIQVDVNVDAAPLQDNSFEVSLTITGEATSNGETVFVIELTYAGVFTLNNLPPEHHGPMLLIEAPRLLFPFARRVIADATGEGGYPPLAIQPIDFLALYQQHVASQQAPDGDQPAEV